MTRDMCIYEVVEPRPSDENLEMSLGSENYIYVATRRDRSDDVDEVDNDEDNNMTTTR